MKINKKKLKEMIDKLIPKNTKFYKCQRFELNLITGDQIIILNPFVGSSIKDGYLVYSVREKNNFKIAFNPANVMGKYFEIDYKNVIFDFKDKQIEYKDATIIYFEDTDLYEVIVKNGK